VVLGVASKQVIIFRKDGLECGSERKISFRFVCRFVRAGVPSSFKLRVSLGASSGTDGEEKIYGAENSQFWGFGIGLACPGVDAEEVVHNSRSRNCCVL